MKRKTKSEPAEKTAKLNPVPVRFDRDEDADIKALAATTGLPSSELIRRAVRFAIPKFRSGEVNILELGAKPA